MKKEQKTKKIILLRTDGSSLDIANLDDEKTFRIDMIRALTENGNPLVMSNFKREISLNIHEMPVLSKQQADKLIKKTNAHFGSIKRKIKKELKSIERAKSISENGSSRNRSGRRMSELVDSSPSIGTPDALVTEAPTQPAGQVIMAGSRVISSERLPPIRAFRQ